MKRGVTHIDGSGVSTVPMAAGAAAVPPPPPRAPDAPRFMSAKQLAEYLQINEKKVYALASDGIVPGTKITGKWLFPRELVDQWLLQSSHGGVLTDRLVLAGSDDVLLCRLITRLTSEIQARALVNYTCTGAALGLALLARRRADACAIHWGPAEESHHRHPALLSRHPEHRQWLLVRAFHREQGLMLSPALAQEVADIHALLSRPLRWAMRQAGAGSHRFLEEIAARAGQSLERLTVAAHTYTEREAASAIAMGRADVAPGTRGGASEFGLGFLPAGWEAFDIALPRSVYFRTLFQKLLDELRSKESQTMANGLGGYDFKELGRLVWMP